MYYKIVELLEADKPASTIAVVRGEEIATLILNKYINKNPEDCALEQAWIRDHVTGDKAVMFDSGSHEIGISIVNTIL